MAEILVSSEPLRLYVRKKLEQQGVIVIEVKDRHSIRFLSAEPLVITPDAILKCAMAAVNADESMYRPIMQRFVRELNKQINPQAEVMNVNKK